MSTSTGMFQTCGSEPWPSRTASALPRCTCRKATCRPSWMAMAPCSSGSYLKYSSAKYVFCPSVQATRLGTTQISAGMYSRMPARPTSLLTARRRLRDRISFGVIRQVSTDQFLGFAPIDIQIGGGTCQCCKQVGAFRFAKQQLHPKRLNLSSRQVTAKFAHGIEQLN